MSSSESRGVTGTPSNALLALYPSSCSLSWCLAEATEMEISATIGHVAWKGRYLIV